MINLTQAQREVVESGAKIKLVMGGARSGKTVTLMSCIVKSMIEMNSKDTKVLIHVPDSRFAKYMFRELLAFIPKDIYCKSIAEKLLLSTVYGMIEIKTFGAAILEPDFLSEIERLLEKYDIIGVDMSTRSSLFQLIHERHLDKFIAVGHCPGDKNNAFYKAWTAGYYGSVSDTQAFKLKTWDNPSMNKEEWENQLISSMGLERYIREYYATWI